MATDEVPTGTWFHNPATGEIALMRAGPAETGGRRVEADLWLQPGAAVAGAHVHDHLVERFEVVRGEVAFRAGPVERRAQPGDEVVQVEPGAVHDWWNAGEGMAQVRVEVEAAGAGDGRPAARFVAMIQTLWSLGALGQVNSAGMPDALWLAAIGREYRDVIRFVRPPAVAQAALFGPLAALARRRGRNPLAPELHGPQAPCVIDDPGEQGLTALLGQAVGEHKARFAQEVAA